MEVVEAAFDIGNESDECWFVFTESEEGRRATEHFSFFCVAFFVPVFAGFRLNTLKSTSMYEVYS